MKHTDPPFALLPVLALAGITLLAPNAQAGIAAIFNTSTVDLQMNYTFAGAVFTGTGLPATVGVDYDFDGEPSHFYDGVGTFVYSMGDGTGAVSGSATLGGETHVYPDAPPDFTSFDPLADSVMLTLGTMGQSSSADSNGSAAIESGLSFFVINYGIESLTFNFDYDYTFSMDLVEDAPDGGEANGFIEIDASLIEDFGTTLYPDIVQEFFGGPANIVNQPGSGQIQFVTTEDEPFAELFIRTNVNSTTLVPAVPEPSRAVLGLLGLGVTALSTLRRRRIH